MAVHEEYDVRVLTTVVGGKMTISVVVDVIVDCEMQAVDGV